MTAQLRLPGTAAPRTTGTCRHCRTEQPTFLYDAKARRPWWYMVAHDHDPAACDGGELCPKLCPGSGYPAVEQVKP